MVKCFGMLPRRLALKVTDLAAYQADREVEKRGPAISQAFDASGKPTKAAEGWARGCGISVEQVERLVTDKGSGYFIARPMKVRQRKCCLAIWSLTP